uniref:Trichohyalin-like n=1 Tax=Diabrotica virgifera virgifera TaxID=50390 RepID=A0A6P7FLT2_DIAVI
MQLQSQKMEENQRETQRKMDETQQKMGQKMDESQQKMDQKMDESQQEMDQKMDETQQKMKQAIEENNIKMGKRLDKYENEVKACLENVRKEMAEQDKKIEEMEAKFENALQEDRREIERKMKEIRNQQNSGERRETIIHSTEDVKIRFGGDVKKLHTVILIDNLKKKVRYIGNFETAKETIRNHLKDEASLWFDSKEEELDNWHKFEQKFLSYFWGKIQQMEINKELQNGRYHDRMGISEKTYITIIHPNS